MIYSSIDNVLSVLNEHFPHETKETLSSRIGISPEQFGEWQKNGKGPARKIFELVKSFSENKEFLHFLKNKNIEQFIKNCLYELEGKYFPVERWKWIWDKIINDPYNIGKPFENIFEKAEIEIEMAPEMKHEEYNKKFRREIYNEENYYAEK